MRRAERTWGVVPARKAAGASIVATVLLAGGACGFSRPPTGADPECSVSPSTREQAIYAPPQMISVLVPDGDGGVLECKAGTKDGCDRLFALDCPVTVATTVGSETTVEFGVVNLSFNFNLTIHSVELEEETSDPAFRLGTFPTTVAPEASEPLSLLYRPEVAGVTGASLLIVSDALNAPDGTVELSVEGTAVE